MPGSDVRNRAKFTLLSYDNLLPDQCANRPAVRSDAQLKFKRFARLLSERLTSKYLSTVKMYASDLNKGLVVDPVFANHSILNSAIFNIK